MRIFRRWAVMALPVIIGAALVLGITAGPASAGGPNNFCTPSTYNGNHQCLNLWFNNQSDRAPIKYYHYGNIPNNNWGYASRPNVVGENCGQPGQEACWPFATGSGYNSRYNNDLVYQFYYWNNPYYCMDQGNYNPSSDSGDLMIRECGPALAQYQLFVLSGADYLVAVQATNRGYAYGYRNHPVWIASVGGNYTDGASAVLSGSYAGALDFYISGGNG
jgi:hypothetical protein